MLKIRNSRNIACYINLFLYSSLNLRNNQLLISKIRKSSYLVKTSVGGKKQKLRKTFYGCLCFFCMMYGIINYDNAISMVRLESRPPVVFPNTASKHVTEMNVYVTAIKKFQKNIPFGNLTFVCLFPCLALLLHKYI